MVDEDAIRSYLSQNLSLLAPDLSLVREEFPLPNRAGGKGFVDILARDDLGNRVIIEIKRSVHTSREAIQEILKYAGLVKQNFLAPDSEIRVIIVSTDWRELIVPFSDYRTDCPYELEGYVLNLDSDGRPSSASEVQPLSPNSLRRFAATQQVYLFEDTSRARASITGIAEAYQELGIEDLVILLLKAPVPNLNALYVAFQRQTLERYLSLLKARSRETFESLVEDVDVHQETESTFRSTEDYLLSTLRPRHTWDELQIGYPEKLDSMVGHGWKLVECARFGYFSKDPHLTDEAILTDVRGTSGTNQDRYRNVCRSTQRARLEEIDRGLNQSLGFNQAWLKDTLAIMRRLRGSGRDYQVKVATYWQGQILDSLYYMVTRNPLAFLPTYSIEVDYFDGPREYEVFLGAIDWDRKQPLFEEVLQECFDGDPWLYIVNLHFRQVESKQLLRMLGLSYVTNHAVGFGEEISARFGVKFRKDKVVGGKTMPDPSVFDFLEQNEQFIRELTSFYDAHMVETGPVRFFRG